MDALFFGQQIERLKHRYGEDKYPDTLQQELWNDFCNLSNEDFANAVDFYAQITSRYARAPGRDAFYGLLKTKLHELRRDTISQLKETYGNCPDCGGLGVVTFHEILRPNETSFVFQCKCPLGEAIYPSLPKQFDAMKHIYISHKERMEQSI